MEDQIKAFTCVLRQTNDANDIMNNMTALLDGGSDAIAISVHDRLGVLDFPDTAAQEANVAASTHLSRAELLERAAALPSDLSATEIDLLKQRFWLDLTTAEMNTQAAAERTIAVSEENWQQVTDQLRKARAMLYDKNEEDALSNAWTEEWRRMMAAHKQRRKQQVESRLATAQPWVKRLWDEDQAEKAWGYAVYCAPEAVNEDYEARRDATLRHAREGAGCGGPIGIKWRLQYLDWPDNPTLSQTPLYDPAGEYPELVETNPEPGHPKLFSGPHDTPDMYTTSQLQARFQALRQGFVAARDQVSAGRVTAIDTQTSHAGLQDGILRNVFLVIDQQCVNSLLSRTADPDDAWVYAVDPDYLQSTDAANDETQPNGYQGYMRVRVQQLVNNFFDARRFHEDEFPMQALWRAAQPSRLQAFVSVKETEQQS
jgi:hypothetical protein